METEHRCDIAVFLGFHLRYMSRTQKRDREEGESGSEEMKESAWHANSGVGKMVRLVTDDF